MYYIGFLIICDIKRNILGGVLIEDYANGDLQAIRTYLEQNLGVPILLNSILTMSVITGKLITNPSKLGHPIAYADSVWTHQDSLDLLKALIYQPDSLL